MQRLQWAQVVASGQSSASGFWSVARMADAYFNGGAGPAPDPESPVTRSVVSAQRVAVANPNLTGLGVYVARWSDSSGGNFLTGAGPGEEGCEGTAPLCPQAGEHLEEGHVWCGKDTAICVDKKWVCQQCTMAFLDPSNTPQEPTSETTSKKRCCCRAGPVKIHVNAKKDFHWWDNYHYQWFITVQFEYEIVECDDPWGDCGPCVLEWWEKMTMEPDNQQEMGDGSGPIWKINRWSEVGSFALPDPARKTGRTLNELYRVEQARYITTCEDGFATGPRKFTRSDDPEINSSFWPGDVDAIRIYARNRSGCPDGASHSASAWFQIGYRPMPNSSVPVGESTTGEATDTDGPPDLYARYGKNGEWNKFKEHN